MICETCIHNTVCKYGEARSNGLYCTGEKCKQYLSTADVAPKSEVARLQEQISDLQDELYSEIETNKHLGAEYIALRKEKNALNIEIEALKIANEKMYSAIEATKAEVAMEIFEEIYKTMNSIYCEIQHGLVHMHADNPETMRRLGKLEGVEYLGDKIAELKKKYTERDK